ncbi:YaiI/YqxD family protein [Pseudovibrio exalbescens]|uniref:YaiI/YqxD family protein n=1 Tax=Pseudovibrio exalbescens TaxID=197461 RepID=UPI00236572A2|nr:YaiI/YqxD family protein [Pseudovibrio exalbescens]MDD7912047.1 YaiI/YqxD family protein [Pseudovibrio exalbescens]
METQIYVDADSCPVKAEVYRVAERFGLKVFVVANAFMNVPRDPDIRLVVVSEGPDEADNWIAERAGARDLVVTQDIPLASRCVKVGAAVLSPKGKEFDENSIGMALATRDLKEDLRSFGEMTGGPPPFSQKDKSNFLQAMDRVLVRILKG